MRINGTTACKSNSTNTDLFFAPSYGKGIVGSEEEAEQGQGTLLAAARNLQERGTPKTIGVS
jgi:hypothetical protein